MKPGLALLGLDSQVLAIGQKAVESNIPLSGIWASDHNLALVASLRLGCCAFPRAAEPLSQACRVVYSETDGPLPDGILSLDVAELSQASPEWRKWLDQIGFVQEQGDLRR